MCEGRCRSKRWWPHNRATGSPTVLETASVQPVCRPEKLDRACLASPRRQNEDALGFNRATWIMPSSQTNVTATQTRAHGAVSTSSAPFNAPNNSDGPELQRTGARNGKEITWVCNRNLCTGRPASVHRDGHSERYHDGHKLKALSQLGRMPEFAKSHFSIYRGSTVNDRSER